MPNPKKPRTPCLSCGKEPFGANYKYCSNRCQFAYQNKVVIERWKAGDVSGLSKLGLVTTTVKRYLREKFANRCCLCGWSEINPYTGIAPLVADHIDGNWRNNREDNLRLLCPNCDSLMATYAGANKGRGRPNRRVSKRALEAQAMVRSKKA